MHKHWQTVRHDFLVVVFGFYFIHGKKCACHKLIVSKVEKYYSLEWMR